jgi:hypothetical protein
MPVTVHAKPTRKAGRSRRARMGPASTAGKSAKTVALRVRLKKLYARTLQAEHQLVVSALEGLAKAAREVRRSGDGIALTIDVKPGNAKPAITTSRHDALDEALADARARGIKHVAEILKSTEMLPGREFASLIGTSPETVNQKRKTGELLGLQGATRGVRFPKWQVTDDGRPLPGLKSIFEILGGDPWTVYRFLTQRHDELTGVTALDAMKSGRLEDVKNVARNLRAGVFA